MAKLLAALIALTVALLGAYAWIRLDVPIERVRVEGPLADAERIQVSEVVTANLRGGMLGADLESLRLAIESLSWPRFVTLRRVWPASLSIRVEKAMVVARWNSAYLTADGQVVQMPSGDQSLPILNCALSAPKDALETYLRMSIVAADEGLVLKQLDENELGEWTLTFADGVTLMLGAERLTERFGRFATVYRQELKARFDEVAHLDARYASGLAVRWELGSATGNALAANNPTRDGHGI